MGPSMRMKGKVAIVTGAGSRAEGIGNGRAAAVLLAREGAGVALLDSVAEWAEATQRLIAAENGSSIVIPCDVTDEAAAAAAVRRTVEEWGRLDVLVNNVGIGGPSGSAVDVDIAEWDRAMRVNVTSMVIMAKYAIPEMVRGGGGAIVNLSSVAGLTGGHPGLLYPTSKGAIVNLTRAMAAHHGKDGIRVNAVAPGMVYTPMVYSRGMSSEMREARRLRSLLQTEGSGWDVGQAVLFLASDEARWITGVTLPVDAGATAGLSRVPVPDLGSGDRDAT
jgi:NAD(P)-dependent dehydrogenase (short-subunit alcohol dehydrogenase family)